MSSPSTRPFWIACAATVLLTLATIATAHDLGHWSRHVAWYVLAGLLWLALPWLIPERPASRRALVAVALLGLLLRAAAWTTLPAHSDDVYRYLWDGRVSAAGINPYSHPPDAPELRHLVDDAHGKINHRQLPTIYPPAAQLAFRLAASLPLAALAAWKLVVALADLGIALLLAVWLRRRGSSLLFLSLWLCSPLVVVEGWIDLHSDLVGVALLVASLVLIETRRPLAAGVALGASALVKPLGLVLGLLRRRSQPGPLLAGAALAMLLLSLPFVGAGPGMTGSTGEFGRRWQANSGLFALVDGAVGAIIARTPLGGRTELAAGSRVARLVSGRDRDEIYGDEVAGLLARAVSLALWLAVVLLSAARGGSPEGLIATALGAFALLSPTLHPWYLLWLVPSVVVTASAARPWALLAALVPLGHLPVGAWRTHAIWVESFGARMIEHGLPLAILLVESLRWRHFRHGLRSGTMT